MNKLTRSVGFVWVALVALCTAGCADGAGGPTGEPTAQLEQAVFFETDLTFQLPALVNPADVAVAATDQLKLSDRARVDANTLGFAPATNVGTLTEVGSGAKVGDLYGRSGITLRNQAVVEGSVFSEGTVNRLSNVTVTGSIETVDFDPVRQLSVHLAYPDVSNGDVSLEPDQSQSIAPGRFGLLRVKSRSTLTLAPGTYYVDQLEAIEPQATIRLSGEGTFVVYVRQNFVFRGAITTTTGQPAQLFIGYLGTNDAYLDAPFDGFVVAPNARIVAARPGNSGALFGKRIELYADATIRHRPLRLDTFFPDDSMGFEGVQTPPADWQAANTAGGVTDNPNYVPGQELCLPGLDLATVATGDMQSEPRLFHRADVPGACKVQYQECAEDDLTLGTATIPNETELNDRPDPADICEAIARPEVCGILEETVDWSPAGVCQAHAQCIGRGFICALVCADASCDVSERRCAHPDPTCKGLLEEANCASARECPELNHTGEPNPRNNPGSVLDSRTTPAPGSEPAPAPPPPPQYPVGSATDHWNNSVSCRNTIGSPTGASAPPESRRIVAGNEKWGIYADPLVEFHSTIQPLSLEGEATLDVGAEGSFAAGAKVWGKDVRVLNVEARAALTTCSFDLSSAFEVFGVLVDGGTTSGQQRDCSAVLAARADVFQPLKKTLVDAVKVWKYVADAGVTRALCDETRASFSSIGSYRDFPFTLDCSNPANWEAAARHWLTYYKAQRDQLVALQGQLDDLQSQVTSALPSGGSIELLNFTRRFTAFDLSFTYPIGPVTVTIEIELSGGWGVHGDLTYDMKFAPTRAGGGIQMRPELDATAFAFAGVGIGPVSFGLSGELLLIRIETPLKTELFLEQTAVTDPRAPKVLQESKYDLPTNVPHAFASGPKQYKWVANWSYGARADLSSLDGRVDLEARINMLFFKKRIRKKLADWRGLHWTPFDFVGGETAMARLPDLGTFGETIFYVDPDWIFSQFQIPSTPPIPNAPLPSLGPCTEPPA